MPNLPNAPESILSAWIALEVLSPQTFRRPEDLASKDQRRVALLNEHTLPWERRDAWQPTQQIYYQIVLGSIRIRPAVDALIERYGDTRIEKDRTVGNVPLAVVIVDKRGCLVDSAPVAVSSFGWGVITALKGKLGDLAQWSNVEPQLTTNIEEILRNQVADVDPVPLTRTDLMRAHEDLIATLDLPKDWIEPVEFAIRSYTTDRDRTPEPILLNSFFLNDLIFANELFIHKKAPLALCRYLGLERPTETKNLICDNAALEEAVRPEKTPLAKWPGYDHHPLVLLQQAAVNIAFDETPASGIVGINGPPGTGKTTLLRDLVAAVITERAEKMATYDDPQTAFQPTNLKLKFGQAWIHLHKLADCLRGFEIIVASSNNKAVENISSELPGIRAIANDAPELRYFQSLSDSLHQDETWGLIAAVLGNAQNRNHFKQQFWWDQENGLRSYLRAATGSLDDENGKLPNVVLKEEPPTTHQDALRRWEIAREKFRNALKESQGWQQRLEILRNDVLALPRLAETLNVAEQSHADALLEVKRLFQQHYYTIREINSAVEELKVHARAKPGFWARLFRTQSARIWKEIQSALLDLQQQESASQTARLEYEKTRGRVARAKNEHNIVILDSDFFEHSREYHKATPWSNPAAQRAREEVFIAAMALHRAFVDAAAKPLRHNLGALMSVFNGQSLPTPEKQELLSDLWASLFLVVPLVSTTFASVNRMLGKLPPESLGWLLVDEAGQAAPQAAVGAIIRTKRAVIVGDPIQIEPVVMLPNTLTKAICNQFQVEPEQYSAPLASAQTLADAASTYTTEFDGRTVGVPLLVHRRCSEPMFTISNKIAYSGLMVPAKREQSSDIREILGPSRWIDIVGDCEDKWCLSEGEQVIRMLRQLGQAKCSPDLYVLTPFVIVAERTRELIRQTGVLKGWINEEWHWTNERVGTVHTAQGREAEAVIIILGAPDPAQTGARNWAGGSPNILNVAVTRAKEVVYVVGNRKLWREAGVFSDLDKDLR
ncbi:MAG TPA: AAA domain-containing protein [Pyrinomonadaceae bacterium]